MSLHKTHICVVKSLVKIAAVSWHSLRRFIKPAPGFCLDPGITILATCFIVLNECLLMFVFPYLYGFFYFSPNKCTLTIHRAA